MTALTSCTHQGFGVFSDIPPIVLGHISKFRYLQCHLICLLCRYIIMYRQLELCRHLYMFYFIEHMLGQLANSMLGQLANILVLPTLWTVYVSLCIHALLLYCTTTVAN